MSTIKNYIEDLEHELKFMIEGEDISMHTLIDHGFELLVYLVENEQYPDKSKSDNLAEKYKLDSYVLNKLSLAAAYIQGLKLSQEVDDFNDKIAIILKINHLLGEALGWCYGTVIYDNNHRQKLSNSASKGLESRNSKYIPLKNWVDRQSNPLKRTDYEFARQLESKIPKNLIHHSIKNPCRIIYEHLRKTYGNMPS